MKQPWLYIWILWFATTILVVTAAIAPFTYAQTPPSTQETLDPPFETFGALPWEAPVGAEPFLVAGVTDGDTFTVIELEDASDSDPWWEPVRMIGIDAPEKDGPYTKEECYGPEANQFLSELLPKGTEVYLQVDNDEDIPDERELNEEGIELDDHDRWLAHVYLRAEGPDDYYLVSEILALGGYVDVKDYEGNTYFVDELQFAEDTAQDEDRGLWGACRTHSGLQKH